MLNTRFVQDFRDLLEELQSWGIKILVTSRQAIGTGLGRAEHLRLGALSAYGEELLMQLAGSGVKWESGEAATLVEICRANALSIKILAAFIKCQKQTPEV